MMPTQRFAWFGWELALPAEWNLTFHHGDAARGALRFADLRQTRLALRWQSPRKPALRLAQMIAKLRARQAKVEALGRGYQVRQDAGLLLLGGAASRLVELEWAAAADFRESTVAPLLATLGQSQERPRWDWSVYGAAGSVHRAARLLTVSLVPGAVTLVFARRGARTVLGSWALAERLLRGRSLRAWAAATLPLVQHHPAGQWQEEDGRARFRVQTRRGILRRPHVHTLELLHDAAANRIGYVQRGYAPGKEQAC